MYTVDEHTLRKIVEAFYEQRCAMVVGTYRMTDFDMRTIPPGIIDHKEWTPENGRNNALRINGLGAPRAFLYTLATETKPPEHQLRRRLRPRPTYQPRVPDRADLRRAVPLPPLGR